MAARVANLRFRIPGEHRPIGAWLASLLPAAPRSVRRGWFEDGRVSIDGARSDHGTDACPPGARVEIAIDEGELPERVPAQAEFEQRRAARWTAIVDAPPWSRGRAPSGDETPGIAFEVLERSADLARLSITGSETSAAQVLACLASLSMPVVGDLRRGGLALPGGEDARRGGLAKPGGEDARRGGLAKPGGEDARRGGVAIGEAGGGPLLAAEGDALPDLAEVAAARPWRWDHDRAAPPPAEPDAGTIRVSVETRRALANGHPWLLPDPASDPATRYRPGALVAVADVEGHDLGWARIEGTSRIAARRWAPPGTRRTIPSIEARVARALARRRELLASPSSETSAYRLIHGEGDALPGLHVDRLGPLLRVLVTGFAALEVRERVVAALAVQLPVTPEGVPFGVLEVLHLRSTARGHVEAIRWYAGSREQLAGHGALDDDAETLLVRERGLTYTVDPGWATPRRPRPGYGLFVDQRDNRARVAAAASDGGRWLNLFAHTGAFSVALLAAGADEVTSVDLSAPYLARLDRNLALNRAVGVEAARHRSLRGDARRALEADPGGLRGIVVDPPTAAAAGRRFWSVRDDLEPLLRLAIDRLAAGGCLLVTQNRAGPPLGLEAVVERLARRAHRPIERIESAPAGLDHPALPGFPEGDPFEGLLLTLR